jgi:hypothetical protein
MVNQNNVVDNTIDWDGNTDTWQPPLNYLLLVQATTPAMVWAANQDNTGAILKEVIGAGGIGFTWNGSVLTTNQPEPK